MSLKADHFVRTHILGRPFNPSARRYELMRKAAADAANVIAPHALSIIPAKSLVDVGCWIGVWTNAFAKHGVERVIGVDGDYINRDMLEIDASCFRTWNLNEPLAPLGLGRFDLAISLEVGEHLLPERADSLVDDLCALADTVLFGAAIPKQGGDGHLNEQWQSYWVAKFRERGYVAYDVLRPAIWASPDVAYWYKQNTLYYVKDGSAAHEAFRKRFGEPSSAMFDVVHPEMYMRTAGTKRGLARLAKNTRRVLTKVTGHEFSQPAKLPLGDDGVAKPPTRRH